MNPDRDLSELWDFDDPAASEARFRAELAATTDPERTAVLRTQVARALGLLENFDEASAELAAVDGTTPLVRCYLELERGRVLRSSGRPDEAPFLAALDIAVSAGLDHLAVDAAHMLAITAEGEAQIPWAERALELAEASADPRARRWVGSVTNNLGWTMHDLGRHQEALALWERALAARIEQGTPEPVRIARWTVARGLRELDRIEEALAIQEDLKANGPPDPFVDEELAELRRPAAAGPTPSPS